MPTVRQLLLPCALLAAAAGPALAQPEPVVYELDDTSFFADGCVGMCLCPIRPNDDLTGRFNLTLTHEDPLFRTYAVTDVDWTLATHDGDVSITGAGVYRVGGEVAITHQLVLELRRGDGEVQRFDSGLVPGGADFPAIDALVSLHGMEGCIDEWFEVRARPRPPEPQPVVYELDDASFFAEGCDVGCRCAVHQFDGLRGTFTLTLTEEDPLFRHYTVTDVQWTLSTPDGDVTITGEGTYRVGGEVAIVQQLVLDLRRDGGEIQRFDSGLVPGGRDFPGLLAATVRLPIVPGCYFEWFRVSARPRPPEPEPVLYRLTEGSMLVDNCGACGRPPLLWPLEGTFELVLRIPSLQTDFYDIVNLRMRTTNGHFHFRGGGTFRDGLGPSAMQITDLVLQINDEPDIRLHGVVATPAVAFPAIETSLREVTDDFFRVYQIRLIAEPTHGPRPHHSDFDLDGDTDLADYMILQSSFSGAGKPTVNPLTDLDGDHDTDLADLLAFQADYTGAR